MEHIVGKMMPQRVQSPYRVIEGMRYPGQGMPVGGVEIKKGPLEESRIEGADMRISGNVVAVVPPDKFIPEREKIYRKRQEGDNCRRVICGDPSHAGDHS